MLDNPNGYDYYPDNLISGTQSTKVIIPVPDPGSHFIDIGYGKDGSVNSGSDCAWFEVTGSDPGDPDSTMPPNPTRSGYDFGGWYTERNGGGNRFTEASPVTGTITVYARWLPVTSVQIQMLLSPTETPLLSNASLFANEPGEFSIESGYGSYQWYWDGETSSAYTLAANSKTPGIYELSVFVTAGAGELFSARCQVTIKAN
jgi:uncharacterized repeat protein (TIGR02543 family)